MRRGKRNNRNKNKNRIKKNNTEEVLQERSSVDLKKLIAEELKEKYPTFKHKNGGELHSYFSGNQKLKMIAEQVPNSIVSDVTLLDASCKNRNREDEIYLHD